MLIIKITKGSATVYWNGRDRENRPVLGNRKYRAKIATFPPIQTKLAASIGNSGKYEIYYNTTNFTLTKN